MPLTTKAISERVSDALSFLSKENFQYHRSFQHFRRTDSQGFSYVGINSVTHNRVDYHFDFHIGVRNDLLESTIKQILHQTEDVTHYDRSLLNWTAHIGPSSPNWKYPIAGTWLVQRESDIDNCIEEVGGFIRSLVLPFLNHHTAIVTIRKTLLELPGHALLNRKPYQQILAADVLAKDVSRFEADYSLLSERYNKWIPTLKEEFNAFYLRAKPLLQLRNLS